MNTNRETRPSPQNAHRTFSAPKRWTNLLCALATLFALPFSILHAGTVYVVADNSTGVNFFGTLDLTSGQFTKIAETTPVFYALTAGPGGILYGADDNSNKLFSITASGTTAPFGSVAAPDSFQGLAYSAATGGFFAEDLGTKVVSLYSISGDGRSEANVQRLDQAGGGEFATGSLAYGPGQKLYFNYSFDTANATNAQLYLVDPATGAETAVGSGLGTQILSLFSDGTTLYGVDTFVSSNIGIYTIDTTSGVATRVTTVTGLPSDNSYYIDAAAYSVPSVSVTALTPTVVEGGKGKFLFARSGDTTAALTVAYKLAGPAINGKDYTTKDGQPLSGSFTIPAGSASAKLKIYTVADGMTEGNERVTLKLSASASDAYTVGTPAKAKLFITDSQ